MMKKLKLSKKKITIFVLSILGICFIVKIPIDFINNKHERIARNKELESLRLELKDSIEEVNDLHLMYEELYSNTIISQTRFEMVMDSILYDYYYSKYYGEQE